MKTKDLIDQLKNADPSGEEEVCVGNEEIHFVSNEPAYYDGALQVGIRNKDNYFDGFEIRRNGRKLQIHTISYDYYLLDFYNEHGVLTDKVPNIKFDEWSNSDYYRKRLEDDITEAKNVIHRVNKSNLQDYVEDKLPTGYDEDFSVSQPVSKFYHQHVKELARSDFNSMGSSIADKFRRFYDDCIRVKLDKNGRLELEYIPGFETKNYNPT